LNIAFITLGCPKNLVDTEIMLGLLDRAGHRLVGEPDGADVAVVNTCSFIASAVAESAAVVRGCLELKVAGRLARVVVAGCLAQRYGDQLFESLPGVDGVVGCSHFESIVDAVERAWAGERVLLLGSPVAIYDHTSPRILGTPSHIAYIKIAEGCDNACSYCTIPSLRGSMRSRPLGSIVAEAEELKAAGVIEANVIAQDTTAYGTDIASEGLLTKLLIALAETGLPWIRLLYAHPARVTDELIEAMESIPAIVPYLDLPIQHISDAVLRRMGRGTSASEILQLIERIRSQIPGISIRSSVIVGFPGETVEHFEELLSFIREGMIDHLGVFEYSPESGTRAAHFEDQISSETVSARARLLVSEMEALARRRARELIGVRVRVLVDSVAEIATARTAGQAWEMDSVVRVSLHPGAARPAPGAFVDVTITGGNEFDLTAELIT
jgi:ribosomal protein S12 methylthiotransferase